MCETMLCNPANRDGRPDSLLWANAAERLSQLMVQERRWYEHHIYIYITWRFYRSTLNE